MPDAGEGMRQSAAFIWMPNGPTITPPTAISYGRTKPSYGGTLGPLGCDFGGKYQQKTQLTFLVLVMP
jgi:hypothetical protein